jgi:Ca2+-binding EF-hand superfamily protein
MKSLGLVTTESEAEDMINEIDLDRSGSIDIDGMHTRLYSILNY